MTRRSGHAPDDGSPDAEGRDRDQSDEQPSTPASALALEATTPEVVLAGFPRGAEPGTFLHAVLEHYDFRRINEPASLERLLAEVMPRHGIEERWRETLLTGLTQVLQTPLGSALGEASLSDIDRRDRLDELTFCLPVAGGYQSAGSTALSAVALAELFARHADPAGPLPASYAERLRQISLNPPLRGFLTGAIDMVFRRRLNGGVKWLLVDYKSNWLGTADGAHSSARHYRPALLPEALAHHDYFLQYHLYLVALHRWLRWRLGEAYDYDRDVGGVLYLFLRGMGGAGCERDKRGRPMGVFHDKPPRALIEGLSELLRAPSSKSAGGGAA